MGQTIVKSYEIVKGEYLSTTYSPGMITLHSDPESFWNSLQDRLQQSLRRTVKWPGWP